MGTRALPITIALMHRPIAWRLQRHYNPMEVHVRSRRAAACAPATAKRQVLPPYPPFAILVRSGSIETFALSGDQTPGPLATTVKLGRASAGLVLCTTLNAATGRRRPLSSRFPRSSNLATASTARATRLLIRICPSFASAHSLAARLHTVPIAV